MSKRTRRRLLKSPLVLLTVFAVALAMTGLVWAHWTDTLEVQGTVRTGDIDLVWTDLSTDDDGVPNDWEGITEDGGGFPLDMWDLLSSADPAAPDRADTYDKDVARCYATGEATKFFVLTAENTYPSYYCSTRSTFVNDGSVPVMQQMLRLQVSLNGDDVTFTHLRRWGGGLVLLNSEFGDPDDPFDRVAFWNTTSGTLCGEQFDPGVEETTANWFHIDEGAPQGATIGVVQALDFVNWNEYDPLIGAECVFDISGQYPLGVQP